MTAGRRAKTGWGSVAVARLDPGIRTSASERTPDVPSTRLHASLGRDCAGAVSTVSIVGSEKRPSAHARLHRPHCIGHMGCVGLGYGRATVNSAPSWLHPSNDQQWVDVSDPSWKNIGRCSHAWHVLAPVIGSLDALANAYASHLDEILAWPTEVADCHLGTQVNDGQHAGRTLGSCQGRPCAARWPQQSSVFQPHRQQHRLPAARCKAGLRCSVLPLARVAVSQRECVSACVCGPVSSSRGRNRGFGCTDAARRDLCRVCTLDRLDDSARFGAPPPVPPPPPLEPHSSHARPAQERKEKKTAAEPRRDTVANVVPAVRTDFHIRCSTGP